MEKPSFKDVQEPSMTETTDEPSETILPETPTIKTSISESVSTLETTLAKTLFSDPIVSEPSVLTLPTEAPHVTSKGPPMSSTPSTSKIVTSTISSSLSLSLSISDIRISTPTPTEFFDMPEGLNVDQFLNNHITSSVLLPSFEWIITTGTMHIFKDVYEVAMIVVTPLFVEFDEGFTL
ncbi:hypothetical protein L1887_34159 [Cichorium endivia]|nr:hypothetical protein L1887_34159 [Cichorium endivia]